MANLLFHLLMAVVYIAVFRDGLKAPAAWMRRWGAAALDLRFDLRQQKEHLRKVGKDLAAMLPPGARLGIIDPKGNGLAALMVRYEMTKDSTSGKVPSVPASYNFADRDK